MATDTKQNKLNLMFITSTPSPFDNNFVERRFRAFDESKLIAGPEKCQGVGCAFKHCCGRFTRPDSVNQQWHSFYALADDDCQYFEPINLAEAKNAEA
jgi:hypothetical protein